MWERDTIVATKVAETSEKEGCNKEALLGHGQYLWDVATAEQKLSKKVVLRQGRKMALPVLSRER